MDTLPEQPLAPLYYRDNFVRLCETVRQQYGDLLTPNETAFLDTFHALSLPAQCLYVRLVSRTGPWFRVAKLAYPEIPALPDALAELQSQALVAVTDKPDLEMLFALYTRPELNRMLQPWLPSPRPGSKADLFDAVAAQTPDLQALADCRRELEREALVAPLGAEHIALLQVLFFGNRHQSLTQFVLEDLGVTRFYPYPLQPEHRLFGCREAVDEYLACGALSDVRWEALETQTPEQLVALAKELQQREIRFASTRSRWDKLCNRLGRDLERLECFDDALAIYALSDSHPGRERRARVLERTGALEQARDLCQTILADPYTEAEADAATTIAQRVLRKLDGTPGKRTRDRFEELHLAIAKSDDGVERATAHHLSDQWSQVHYVENRLMGALFGLAFWDIIFADEPGVFHHPFQGAPSDMYDASFRRRRRAAIDARLAHLATADLAVELTNAYERFYGYSNHWVDWRGVDTELVGSAARVIPAQHLIAIWRRLLFDPQENRRGFPDLIALGQTPGDYAMIEVKGPGDALQDSQKRWLRFFARESIPAQVAWITWSDD